MDAAASILLDACALINLVASRVELAEIARETGFDFLVTTIAAEESLFVGGDADGDSAEPVSVEALADAGQLTVTPLTDLELTRFVAMARLVDDGEASTLAVASERGLDVATDDRRAIRLANEIGVRVVTTAQLLKRWAERGDQTPPRIQLALRNVEQRGNFRPRRDDPEREWWLSYLAPEA